MRGAMVDAGIVRRRLSCLGLILSLFRIFVGTTSQSAAQCSTMAITWAAFDPSWPFTGSPELADMQDAYGNRLVGKMSARPTLALALLNEKW